MDYKIYLLTPAGRIFRSHDFQGPDDSAALNAAQEHSFTADVEIWQQSRLVVRVAKGESSSPSLAATLSETAPAPEIRAKFVVHG